MTLPHPMPSDALPESKATACGAAGSGLAVPDNARRGLLLASLATGFAASVQPGGALLAQVISTPADGLDAGMDHIEVQGARLPVYRAVPKRDAQAPANLPVVLVVQEIFGVHEHIRDLCRRFARLGYLAIAPELYFRQGDPGQYREIPELFAKLVSKVPDAQVLTDLDATLDWSARHGGDPGRAAITGFCWGGRIVWLYGAHQKKLRAGAAWYGRLDGQRNDLQPAYPVDIAARLNAPVLGLYGGADTGIPVDSVEAMRGKLAEGSTAARASRIHLYPDAPHAFLADYRPSYRKADAEDGWKRMLEWFGEHGVAPRT